MIRRPNLLGAWFGAVLALLPAGRALAGPETGVFSAVVSGLLDPGLPADPLGLAGGALGVGAAISGSFSIASGGYAVLITGPGQIAGYSDGVPGLIGVTFGFGAAAYAQSDADFNEVSFNASGGLGVYDSVSFNANDVAATGVGTQTIFHLDPSAPLTGDRLAGLVDTPFSADLGTIEFYEFVDDVAVGGFRARITEAVTSVPEPGTPALLGVAAWCVWAGRLGWRRRGLTWRRRFGMGRVDVSVAQKDRAQDS